MDALEQLRAALVRMDAAGPNAFEGFIAIVLEAICGRPFRIARSGSQGGRDGEAISSLNAISFECKLYTGPLDAAGVRSKIVQLIASPSAPDVWVLAATVEVGAQLAAEVKSVASKNGISVLILDWPSASALPPLAAACAIASAFVPSAVAERCGDQALVPALQGAIANIQAVDGFHDHAALISQELAGPSLGMANALSANRKWLAATFSDPARARAQFGQAIAPNAAGLKLRRQRPDLANQVRSRLTAPPVREILAITGAEGCGKSWLLAEGWLELSQAPLTIILSATDMRPHTAYGDFEPFLIAKIIQQTDDRPTEDVRKRWERRLAAWSNLPSGSSARLALCVDGLNEQPTFEWPRWLDATASHVERMAGILIVTARRHFFDANIRRSTNTPFAHIDVPEWSTEELDQSLRSHGIDPAQVAPAVHDRLRNPRILSIALKLLNATQIKSFTELSVDRLLFEHIRASATESTRAEAPDFFQRRLAEHANEIIARAAQDGTRSQPIFDLFDGSGRHVLTAELLAGVAEHFYRVLPDEGTFYTLPDDSLRLALGLAILQALRLALTRSESVDETLRKLLEPISALDKTADAVFSALVVSSIDDRSSVGVVSALMGQFLRLQNVNDGYYEPFVGIVRAQLSSSLGTLEALSKAADHPHYREWLHGALSDLRSDEECWAAISHAIGRWLRAYSLAPELGVFTRREEDPDKHDREASERSRVLKRRLSSFSKPITEFIEQEMWVGEDFDPTDLHREAIRLLVGMPLAQFARGLVACALSQMLNSGMARTYDEFLALIRFNQRDWAEAAVAFSQASAFLDVEPSTTAKWTKLQVLRALSREEDGRSADQLLSELSNGHPKRFTYRLIEKYSDTDPCDPEADEPTNLEGTRERYHALDTLELTKTRFSNEHDHFFKDARTALARFAPSVAIEKIREYARSASLRDSSMAYIAMSELESLSSALDTDVARDLLKFARVNNHPRPEGQSHHDRDWLAAQYAMLAAFPHMSGDEQIHYLIDLPPHGPPLTKFADVVRPASPALLSSLMQRALESGDKSRALVALTFAGYSRTPLDDEGDRLISLFMRHEESSVRALAFDVAAMADSRNLLEDFASISWTVESLDRRENWLERWYGSVATVAAARHGLIDPSEATKRISPKLLGYAAQELGSAVRTTLVAKISAAVRYALRLDLPFEPPRVAQRADDARPAEPQFLEMIEPKPERGLQAFVREMNETNEQFEDRQRKYWSAFDNFVRTLDEAQAWLIIEDVGASAIAALIQEAREVALGLARILLEADASKTFRLTSFSLRLARGLAEIDPGTAVALFRRFENAEGVVNLRFGASEVSLAALMIWSSQSDAEVGPIRTGRLDRAKSDFALSQEVAAALMAGRQDVLDQYARTKLQSPIPADVARAIMVLGFGLESSFATETLSRSASAESIIGKALIAARYAYERDRWSRHWYDLMMSTDSSQEFWRCSEILLKIVDARIDVWGGHRQRSGQAAKLFWTSLRTRIERRSARWRAHREKTLCGDKVPKFN